MKQIDEAGLAAWHAETHRRKDSRLIENRYFQGTVAGVTVSGSAYEVAIQRVGEPAADGNTYHCAVPGYVPQVGDRVELAWRDRSVAHVDHPIATTTRHPASSAVIDSQAPVNVTSLRIPFSGALPPNYTSMKVRWQVRTTSGNTADSMYVQFNGDTGTTYSWGTDGSSSTAYATPVNTFSTNQGFVGNPTGGATTAAYANGGFFEILNYTSVNYEVMYIGQSFRSDSSVFGRLNVFGVWRPATPVPVTSLVLFLSGGNFAVGSWVATEVF